jgi:hypothetical protein
MDALFCTFDVFKIIPSIRDSFIESVNVLQKSSEWGKKELQHFDDKAMMHACSDDLNDCRIQIQLNGTEFSYIQVGCNYNNMTCSVEELIDMLKNKNDKMSITHAVKQYVAGLDGSVVGVLFNSSAGEVYAFHSKNRTVFIGSDVIGRLYISTHPQMFDCKRVMFYEQLPEHTIFYSVLGGLTNFIQKQPDSIMLTSQLCKLLPTSSVEDLIFAVFKKHVDNVFAHMVNTSRYISVVASSAKMKDLLYLGIIAQTNQSINIFVVNRKVLQAYEQLAKCFTNIRVYFCDIHPYFRQLRAACTEVFEKVGSVTINTLLTMLPCVLLKEYLLQTDTNTILTNNVESASTYWDYHNIACMGYPDHTVFEQTNHRHTLINVIQRYKLVPNNIISYFVAEKTSCILEEKLRRDICDYLTNTTMPSCINRYNLYASMLTNNKLPKCTSQPV